MSGRVSMLCLCACALVALKAPAEPAAPVRFMRDVRPILARSCFACHGPDDKHRKAGLRLDIAAGALADRKGVVPFVAGHPEKSEVLRRISSADAEERMPPGAGKQLPAEQIELIRRWIAQGAKWEAHWAFQRPVRPPLPAVRDTDWPRSAIDRLVLARLEAEGLRPTPQADRITLIRRVSLDLTGLPPSLEDAEAFAKDDRPDAYERLVERLLASPGYGERWARVWLDLARYADTKGYEKDLRRSIWRYRDWVIEALNADLLYDQFTTQQLAGDLLPSPTPEQLLATAFHRNTLTNDEGGTDDEEFRVAAVKDRVDTTLQIWMGLTMGCAKCHSHKYDPISQKEYYQFYAFFNQTRDSDKSDDSPTEPLPSRRQQEQIDRLEARRKELSEVEAILKLPPAKRSEEQNRCLAAHGPLAALPVPAIHDLVAGLQKEINDLRESTRTPVFQELPPAQQRTTHVHVRGNFLDKGEVVEPATPAAFHTFPKDAPANRLGVAQWLMHPDNPLTARVAVNRHWAQFFGRGLVETQEDFGSQGQPPSHPELLDWLAVEFRESGWSFKQLCRLIVTSATYRQASAASADLLARDGPNRLLARGPRFRLDAEAVRDTALAASGLLSHKMFGPSVMPHQPEGIWRSTYSTDKWVLSPGEDRYRRGLYTFVKRTSPYPAMTTFDAPSREVCTVRRISTNTPLQALVTLNDTVFVEAAQALARRAVRETGTSPADRIALAFRLALLRAPRPREVEALVGLYARRLEAFGRDLGATRKFATEPLGPLPPGISAAELAALTAVCNVLLNLDELLTRG